MKNSLAVAMGRVSTFTQAAQGMSLADQDVLFPEYAQKHGHHLQKAFSFNESAATSDKRRLFREVVEHIKAHDIGHFYVEDTERLTRDSMDIPIINDLAINHSVTLHFIRDGYVLDKDMENFVNFMMRLTFGQETILRLRKKMKAKMLHLVSQGQWPMRPPWCSRIIEKKLIWQDVAPLQELYQRRADGASIAQLHDWLTVSGHKPPRGEAWHQQTIVKILQNPANIGKLRWKGVLHEATHPAVISEDLFEKVQKTFTLTSRKNNRRAHLFSGLLRLEGNGRLFSGEEQKGRVYYAAYTKPRGPRVWLSEDAIFDAADEIMRRIQIDSHFGGFITDVAKDMVKFQYAHVGRKIQAKEKLISELRGKAHQVYQDRLDGIIGLDLYKEKSAEISARTAAAEKELRGLRASDQVFLDGIESIVSTLQRVPEIYQKAEPGDKVTLLRDLLDGFRVTKEKEISPIFKPVFEIFARPELSFLKKKSSGKLKKASPTCLYPNFTQKDRDIVEALLGEFRSLLAA